jgi:hypothetical protein
MATAFSSVVGSVAVSSCVSISSVIAVSSPLLKSIVSPAIVVRHRSADAARMFRLCSSRQDVRPT